MMSDRGRERFLVIKNDESVSINLHDSVLERDPSPSSPRL